ncbi:DNA methyltransferase [Arthrobacter sp. MYb211]|uniref:DNA cytosine methyltransferase n=1 Tax=unclassified Arthrobacter TaxID=235627 RepID=UPI000CFD60BE|nr:MULTISPECIES: DNA cytosine methyltransferase [unclassified Arthrobacter]PRA13301.1 DNA methyltransferase [Arthrobacter sp. MYb221]PRC10498.1 DNA methyltransferase [Arthrobacter sp. MYb211]
MTTITDMFCGAGGSSTGLLEIPGVTVKTAMNHWARAIETHNTNHPDTDHVLADIKNTDPRYIAGSDVLWASPECTNHSVAKGKRRATNQPDLFGDSIADEAAEKSRATMWDVPRYAEQHKYKIIMTENVVDAARWVMFEAWLHAMELLGYEHHIVYLNSMHAQLGGLPAPQSRDRMYVVFWIKGNPKPDFDKLRPEAYCPTCDKVVRAVQSFKNGKRWGRYRAQYVYRCPHTTCRNQIIEPAWLPAAHAIDWTIRGQRIGDRKKALADKTMARIKAGLEKYGSARIAIDAVRGSQILADVDSEPFATQTTAYTRGLLTPLIVNNLSGSDSTRTDTVDGTLRTLVAGGLHESLLIPVEGRDGKYAQLVHEAMRTQTTRNETGLLTTPGHHMLMEYYGNGVTHPLSKAIPTIPTVDRFAMITTMRGTAENQLSNSSRPTSDPLGTLTAGGNHHGLTEWTVEDINECEFRMLEPHEISAGMAFPKDYIMTGNKREQVKQAGNAVTPPAARDIGTVAVESLLAN